MGDMKKLRQGSSQVAYEIRRHYCLSKDNLICEKAQSRGKRNSEGKGSWGWVFRAGRTEDNE